MGGVKGKRIGVLMGGPSRERDISMKSGRAVCRALESNGLKPVPLELIKASTLNGYRNQASDMIRLSNIDVAFIALHGEFGEDGRVQEILEDLGIPYTGSRVDASTLGMDKIGSKAIFKSRGIPTPRYKIITDKCRPLDAREYFESLGLPLVIKPSGEGSSIGLSMIELEKEFTEALNKALEHGGRAVIEEYIAGREITVGILEDRALPVVEIIPGKRFFDFEAKYQKGMTEYRVPADMEREVYDVSQKIALESHNALGARFFSRVDMILTRDNIPMVLEVNTIPGLTETSLLPKAAHAAGIDFNQLAAKILESALW